MDGRLTDEEIHMMLNATKHRWEKHEEMCEAFPHLKARMAEQVSIADSHLLISTLVFEPIEYLELFFNNLLAFTRNSTVIVAHLSSVWNYTEEEVTSLVHHHPRLFINCHRYFTHAYHGSLAHAHLRNIGWARHLGLDFHHVLLMASNSWFIKFGVEDYIDAHGASLGTKYSKAFNRFTKTFDTAVIDKRYHWSWNPKATLSRVWCWEPMHTIVAPSPSDRIYQTKHEGAFFPAMVMLALHDALLAVNGSNSHPCPNNPKRWLENTTGLGSMLHSRMYLEEYVFQTWGLRHLEECQPANGVTVIALYGGASTGSKMVDAIKVKEAQHWPDVFGIKPISREVADVGGAKAYIMGELLHEQSRKYIS